MIGQTKRAPARPETGGVSACIASLVLALATGTSVKSAPNFLPHPEEQKTPYLGV